MAGFGVSNIQPSGFAAAAAAIAVAVAAAAAAAAVVVFRLTCDLV
jgi:hypothetical protein